MSLERTDQTGLQRPYGTAVDWLEDLSETQFAYLMLVPVFLLMGVMAFWPLVRTFEMSLFADAATAPAPIGEFVGLENYVDIVRGDRTASLPRPFWDGDRPLASAIPVTFVFTAGVVVVETLLGLTMALVLNENFEGRRWLRMTLILPWAVPIVIQGMIFFLLFNNSVGIAGIWLSEIGVFTRNPLSTPENALLVVMVADVWKQTPFIALLVLAGLQSIDRDLYEVARVSGATRWERFKTVTFPLVLPTLLVAMLFRSIGAMKIYGTIVPIAGCNTVPSLSCVVVSTFNSRLYGTSTAVAVLMAVIIGSLMMFYIIPYARTNTGGV